MKLKILQHMNWINKYWKAIIVVISMLLVLCIVLLIRAENRYKEAIQMAEISNKLTIKAIEENKINSKKNQMIFDSLVTIINEKNIIIIKEETRYETIKKSPINTNYTSAELNEYVKSLESEYKKLGKTSNNK